LGSNFGSKIISAQASHPGRIACAYPEVSASLLGSDYTLETALPGECASLCA
jgi:hypothetical protein